MLRQLALAAAIALAAPVLAQPIELNYMPSGAHNKLGGYHRAQTLTLTTERPAGMKKAPAAADADVPNKIQAKFGVLKLGPVAKATSFYIAVIEDESGKSELFVDANADGDLTNDAAPSWTTVRYSADGDPIKLDRRVGYADLQVPLGETPRTGRVSFYKLDLKDPAKQDSKNKLFYYRDYGYEGSIKLGQWPYKVFLSDETTMGDFVGSEGHPSEAKLYIDINGNNNFNSRNEAFDLRKPFAIGDVTYAFKNVTPSGSSFEITTAKGGVGANRFDPAPAPAPAPAAPAVEKPDLTPGKIAPSFMGRDLDGKELNFPQDFKGKLVLIDFWATWCRPCVNEMPTVIAAYEKFHAQGLEVVGVSLDQKEREQALRDFVANNKMPWRQVFDGGYWKAAVAQLYGVNSIPFPILIEGDTGKIVAVKNTLRGASLQPTIEKALKAKQAK